MFHYLSTRLFIVSIYLPQSFVRMMYSLINKENRIIINGNAKKSIDLKQSYLFGMKTLT